MTRTQQIRNAIQKKIGDATRSVAERLNIGIADSSLSEEELLKQIALRDSSAQALIADYANAANEWLECLEKQNQGQLESDSPEIQALTAVKEEAEAALMDFLNKAASA